MLIAILITCIVATILIGMATTSMFYLVSMIQSQVDTQKEMMAHAQESMEQGIQGNVEKSETSMVRMFEACQK